MRKTIFAIALAACAWGAQASGLDSLEAFVKSAKSGRAEFTQVVTAPAREGQAARSKTSAGTFEFQRPSRFRFDYKKPFEQTIVADGQTLWLYDVDLSQVTARKQAAVLGSTPAAIIASAPDIATLRKDFNLEAAPEKDGMQWVQATPKVKDGQLTSMKVGFRGNELGALEILDSFGQRSVLTFSKMQLNAAIPAEQFQFKPPQGVAVLKQ
jgi:outer membrane lipoprotein carrier protein